MFTPIIGNAGCLPVLLPDQVRKLKQLSVLTLAEIEKVLMNYSYHPSGTILFQKIGHTIFFISPFIGSFWVSFSSLIDFAGFFVNILHCKHEFLSCEFVDHNWKFMLFSFLCIRGLQSYNNTLFT